VNDIKQFIDYLECNFNSTQDITYADKLELDNDFREGLEKLLKFTSVLRNSSELFQPTQQSKDYIFKSIYLSLNRNENTVTKSLKSNV